MKTRSLLSVLFVSAWIALSSVAAKTATLPFVSPIFGDNMVLQRDQPNRFWGWTNPGERVSVTIGGKSAHAVADKDGRWEVRLAPPRVGTDCTVQIDGREHVTLQHAIVGDVWVCSGQSNMEFALANAEHGTEEVAQAEHPQIRLFKVASRSGYAPVDVPKGKWLVCSPATVKENGGFSAVAYFFARRVQAETGVPIGLVEACLGGTPVECWMSPAAVAATGQFSEPLAEIARLRARGAPEYGNYIMHWYDEYDAGIRGQSWAETSFDASGWKTVQLPGAFAQLGVADVPAVVWFRREIELPDPLPKGQAIVRLGVVDKMETTYVNGQFVGASSWVENPRRYRVPAGLLHPGRNVIALRVLKLNVPDAFKSPPEQLQLAFADGGPDLPLAGEWKAAVSVDARPPHALPMGYENYPIMPTVLYNGMIHPLLPLAIKGALWYQGEANSSRAHQYRTLLPALIKDWRSAFGVGEFPFYIAELPAFQPHRDVPGSDGWAELREAQAYTAATVPNTGVAVTIDVGDAGNIHPKQKLPVGERLAALALAKTYGKSVVFAGPTYRSFEKHGGEIRIHFDHVDGGLKVHGDKLAEFSVAGADRQWHWAEAKIDGDDVVVSCPEVTSPEAVRYAWQSNPVATLFNGAGFPAAPFRTDDWPGVTDNAKPW